MNSDQPMSPRRRLQVLLAIPDSQRSEAEWDELVELEISLAPGNRADGARHDHPGPPRGQNTGGKPRQNNPQQAKAKKPQRKTRNRGPRGNNPPA